MRTCFPEKLEKWEDFEKKKNKSTKKERKKLFN